MNSINEIEIMNQLKTIVELQQEVVLGIIIALAVIGLIVSFFGLKLMRLLDVLIGFTVGAAGGLAAVILFGLVGLPAIGVIAVAGLVLAILCGVFYRFGSFLWAFAAFAEVLIILVPIPMPWILIVAGGLGLVYAIVTAIYPEPFMIIVTAIWGGTVAGVSLLAAAGFTHLLFRIAAVVVISAIGIFVQFKMRSKEVGKKDRIQSEKVKESVSRETEVEMARQILDSEDENVNLDKEDDIVDLNEEDDLSLDADIEIIDDIDELDDIEDIDELDLQGELEDDFDDGEILEFDYDAEDSKED